MNPSLKYSVQIITEEDQVTNALNLRYRVYKKVFPLVTQAIAHPYESDEFDQRSIHIGLYCEDGSGKKLAGYCRLIMPEYFSAIYANQIVKAHEFYLNKTGNMTAEKLLFCQLVPANIHCTINPFCNAMEKKGIVYSETSRFIIAEEHRSMSLSAFFVSGMFAICDSLNIKYSFFTCTHHHIAFYSRYGLTLFPGIPIYENKIYGSGYVVFGTDLTVANKIQNSIRDLRFELEVMKEIVFRKAA